MSWLKWVVLLLAVVTLLSLALVYQYGGLKQYLWVKQSIAELEGERKDRAVAEFYAQDKREYVAAGVVGGITTQGEGGVWVWSNNLPRYYAAYGDTVYSYYDVCALLGTSGGGTVVKVNDMGRSIVSDIGSWAGQAWVGDYVQVILATEGEHSGKAREIVAYDVPLFLNINMEEQCAH